MLRDQLFAIAYHDIFEYPLKKNELQKWKVGEKIVGNKTSKIQINNTKGFYFVKGNKDFVAKRQLREKISKKKIIIAKHAARLLGKIPTVRFIGITGALAMNNTDEDSDIDLLIITSKSTLWTTRLIVYLALLFSDFKLRHPNNSKQNNRLCLNMWMDEGDLELDHDHRNIYSAHEVAQIVPLVNKKKTYERFLLQNKWILDYWPNAVEIQASKEGFGSKSILSLLEPFTFWLQYKYMKTKITREVVTRSRAFFHPKDWGKVVDSRLRV